MTSPLDNLRSIDERMHVDVQHLRGVAHGHLGALALSSRAGTPSDDPDARRPFGAAARPHHDVNVLAKPVEELHQPSGGKTLGVAAEQQRDLRLRDAELARRVSLAQSSRFHQVTELRDEHRPGEFVVGTFEAEVAEDIAAAALERRNGPGSTHRRVSEA